MTRKFLFCFPLRTGNIVLGYIVITIAIMVFGYHLYELGLTMVSKDYENEKFRNFQNIENIFGKTNASLVAYITMSYYTSYCAIAFLLFLFGVMLVCGAYQDYENEKFLNFQNIENIFGKTNASLVAYITMSYYTSYCAIAFLLFLFGVMLVCGAYQANHCLVATFFVYSFFHMFLTVILIVWEAVSEGWIQIGLIALSDVLLIICLFSVKYLMEAIRTGNIYSRPGEVLCSDKYNTLTNRSMREREPKYYYKDFDR